MNYAQSMVYDILKMIWQQFFYFKCISKLNKDYKFTLDSL